MKIINKKFFYILIIFILIISVNSNVFALDIIQKGDSFLNDADANEAKVDPNKINDLSDKLSSVLLSVGIVIAVIVATVLGIQFMMGGAEGQAKVKEMLIPFVVGCVVVFGAVGIWKIALAIGKKFETAYVQNKGVCIVAVNDDIKDKYI